MHQVGVHGEGCLGGCIGLAVGVAVSPGSREWSIPVTLNMGGTPNGSLSLTGFYGWDSAKHVSQLEGWEGYLNISGGEAVAGGVEGHMNDGGIVKVLRHLLGLPPLPLYGYVGGQANGGVGVALLPVQAEAGINFTLNLFEGTF
jgi:hypothetical protein